MAANQKQGIDLDAIEAAARGATPGPWEVRDHDDGFGSNSVKGPKVSIRFALRGSIHLSHEELAPLRDAHHIATMDPLTTLALVERVRELEAEVARQRARDEQSAKVTGL